MVHNRWLKMKKIIFSSFLAFTLVSCVSQMTIVSATPTNDFAATSILNNEPVATFTPVVTATPIKSNKQSLELALDAYLDLSDSCEKVHRLKASNPDILFSETRQKVDSQTDFVSEIAKSASNKYSAYIVQHFAVDIISGSVIPIYCEHCSKVYLENNQNGKRYEISWNIFPPDISMIYSIIWVDDNILVIREAQNENVYLVLGIDVENQKPVYFSEVSCSNQ